MVEYLEYIVAHDLSKNLKESVYPKKKKFELECPTKGNKKNKRKEKTVKKRAKKRSIKRVMDLIDSFRDDRMNTEGIRYCPVI